MVDFARLLAQRLVASGGTKHERLQWAYRMALARNPTADEEAALGNIVDQQTRELAGDAAAAGQLVGRAIDSSDRHELALAVYTFVARVVLNLDEFIMRE